MPDWDCFTPIVWPLLDNQEKDFVNVDQMCEQIWADFNGYGINSDVVAKARRCGFLKDWKQ